METKFDVIILTEIGARNLSVVLNLFPAYTFHYVRPQNNNYGGVGIYTHNSLLNVVLMEDLALTKSCDCSKCEFESLFIEFVYNGILYTVGGIYRHPSGNVSHFVSSLETILTKLDDRKNVILAGDMNIDLIKHTNENVMSYMSTMMSYRCLPYVTLPTRITQFSTTCIDHIFVKKSHKEKVLSTLCGMFYCDISDHLPCLYPSNMPIIPTQEIDQWPEYLVPEIVPGLYKRWRRKIGMINTWTANMIGIINS